MRKTKRKTRRKKRNGRWRKHIDIRMKRMER
jgi:hypothetical protein